MREEEEKGRRGQNTIQIKRMERRWQEEEIEGHHSGGDIRDKSRKKKRGRGEGQDVWGA